MTERSRPVEIIGVDTDTVEKDTTFPKAYAFYIQLSGKPDSVWERYLGQWKNALYQMKREIIVIDDKLRLVFEYGENLRNYVKYAKFLVKWVNERVEEHNRQLELKEKKAKAEQDTDQKKEEEIRRKLREL